MKQVLVVRCASANGLVLGLFLDWSLLSTGLRLVRLLDRLLFLDRVRVIVLNLRLRWLGRIVSFTILTSLTPLPPTGRTRVRGRNNLLGRVGAAWPPCSIRLR